MNTWMLISLTICPVYFVPLWATANWLNCSFFPFSLVNPPPSRLPSGSSWWLELGLSVGQSSCQPHQNRPRGLRSRNSHLPAQRERYIFTWSRRMDMPELNVELEYFCQNLEACTVKSSTQTYFKLMSKLSWISFKWVCPFSWSWCLWV